MPPMEYDKVKNEPQMNLRNTGRGLRRKKDVWRIAREQSLDTDLIFCVPNASLPMQRIHLYSEQIKISFLDWMVGMLGTLNEPFDNMQKDRQ